MDDTADMTQHATTTHDPLGPRDPAARVFLKWVTSRHDQPDTTQWGPYRCFDGYALACFATGHTDTGRALVAQTLDMIDRNLADERDGGDQWHLADFALHPLLHLYVRQGEAATESGKLDHELWERFEDTVRNFEWHYGDLTENHNLLHAAARLVVIDHVPGCADRLDADASRNEVLGWMDRWFTQGSGEWGAETYYNVNLLALLNLYDLCRDPEVQAAAAATLDLIALDQALDRFGGAMCGAARRSYSVYRVDGRENPSRALHHLWFADDDDAFGAQSEPFNTNFIGGAILAAVSRYRPPHVIQQIARHAPFFVSSATHTRGLWDWGPIPRDESDPLIEDHVGRHTWRCADAMLSVMNSGGGRARFTEQVWQATLGERAVVFANQPVFMSGMDRLMMPQIRAILDGYVQTLPPDTDDPRWHRAVGNMPPGHGGDLRPGFWQGNEWGPRSFGVGRMAMLVYHIGTSAQLPWVHLYFPRQAFDSVEERGRWIVARRGDGYLAVWLSCSSQWETSGLWADRELRFEPGDAAMVVRVGSCEVDGSFEVFVDGLNRIGPVWDAASLQLHADCEDSRARIILSYLRGPLIRGKRLETKGDRLATPWGSLPLGERAMSLAYNDHRHEIALPQSGT